MPDSCSLQIIGIVGCGAMGRGIVQIAALAGCTVKMLDAQPGAADSAKQTLADTLEQLQHKGKLTADQVAAALARMQPVESLAALADCELVIEAVVENLEIKRALFAELEAVLRPDAVLASNTSSLSITAIAAGCTHPERVAGYHFFNPVPLMRVVEVIEGVLTAPHVAASLADLARRMGHTPVRAKDTPGFVVNHAGRGFGTEALRIVGEGVADFVNVDRVLREAAGFRLGPFELFDLTGLDVSHPVMESIYHQYYEEPRFRPSVITAQRLTAGLLGRKTSQGFYDYSEGRQLAPAEPAPPLARPAAVWVSPAQPAACAQVQELVLSLRGTLDTGRLPRADSLIVVTPLGEDASFIAARDGLDASRVVALDTLLPLSRRRTLMTTPATNPAMRDAAHGLFASDNVPLSVIRDSAGLIAPRVIATIVNIGCDIAQQRIATPADIDLAVTLGLGYPQGPLAMGDAHGPERILAILETMLALSGDPRYRPSPWLRRR
ncbi:MAG TPA: 3-hydroxyacyl-CoA dehydrogenase, partial [Burkholderiaceae bacterium]|nr:3-hydroxyacyl-CoA dehydrogenase [Burkholderiaceae bacterium]